MDLSDQRLAKLAAGADEAVAALAGEILQLREGIRPPRIAQNVTAGTSTEPKAAVPRTLFPVIVTPSVESARDFYVRHFGFRTVFDADWYVHLHGGNGPGRPLELAFMRPGVETQPQPLRAAFFGEGVILTIEVADVDAVYESLRSADALGQVIAEPTDEAWGQRHFLIRDPAGVLLDVVRPIEPSDEYTAAYDAGKPK